MLSVSGLLPIKNGIKYLPETIEHILLCLSPKDELLVIDDGSSDGTFEVVSNLCATDSRLRLEKNPGSGLVDALNFGISISHYNWLARFDIDDVYDLSRVPTQISAASPSIGAIFCDYEIISVHSRAYGVIPSPIYQSAVAISLAQGNRTPHPGSLLNKQAVVKVGGYIPSEFPVEDLGLWIRLVNGGFNLVSLPETFLRYRVHQGSVTMTKYTLMKERSDSLRKGDFLPGLFEKALADSRDIMIRYKYSPYRDERQFLFMVDLFVYWKNHSKHSLINLFAIAKLLKILRIRTYCLVLPSLLIDKLRRNVMRS